MALYLIPSGPMQTTAPFATLALAAATVKTLVQYKPSATIGGIIVEAGISFDASSAGVPGSVEVIETDVAATVTAHDANSITKYDARALMGGDPTTNLIQVGTAATGYNASAEGTITAVRNLGGPQLIAPTNQNIIQLPLGREPFCQISKFIRIRAKFAAVVNCYAYLLVEI